ncbi:MAG: DUF1080 domain-containing protein [Verrucomicrobiota bacterium]
MKKLLSFTAVASVAIALFSARADEARDGWISLFNGKDLSGWKVNEENPSAFSVQDGAIHIKGGRSHIFYAGEVKGAKFRNFEFKAKVLTKKNANSGIYFATEYQKDGWPAKGYECQVNNSFDKDPRRTGSLYAIRDVQEKLVPDDQWFDYHIKVDGQHVTIAINGKTVSEYTEKPTDARDADKQNRWIKDGGTFAFQAHDPGCEAFYKDIQVKPLP